MRYSSLQGHCAKRECSSPERYLQLGRILYILILKRGSRLRELEGIRDARK